MARAEIAAVLVPAWALELAEVAHEALVAVAHRLELVVDGALPSARAKVFVAVPGAQQVALAAKESRHALALGSAFVANRTVTLAGAHGERVALALAAWASEGTLVAKEARVASAI